MATSSAPADEQVVERVINLTKPGEDSHKQRTRKYDRAYEVYRAAADTRTIQPWQSRLRVPYAQQVLDTALVNIVSSGRPRCEVKPRLPDDELNAKKMQLAMDYYVLEDHMVEKQPVFVQQGLLYGITIAKNHWLYRETTRPTRTPQLNPLDLNTPLMVQSSQTMVERDGPTFEPWNVYDAWWDPNARDVDAAKYFVLRSWARMEDLRAQQVNPETGTGLYNNLDLLEKTGPGRRQSASAQERFNDGLANKHKDMVELLEVWQVVKGEVFVAVIGNRQVLLRFDRSPYWHGKFPIVVAQPRPDLFELQGIPETDLVDHLQQALWTVQNMRMDNLHLTVMRGITYREGGVNDPNQLVLKPRFKWAVQDHDDIRPFEVQPLPPEAYREEEGLLGRMQLVTGINPYVTGAAQPGVDQNTATGVSVLSEVASRLLRFKAAQIQYKGYQRSFEMWGDMIQQFLDHDISVKITGSEDEGWHKFGPADVVGHFHYLLSGSEESLSQSQRRSEALALLNAVAPLAQTGLIDFQAILLKIGEAFDLPNPAELIKQQPPMPPASPQGGQGGGPQVGQILGPQIGTPQLQNGGYMQPSIAQAITRGG